MGTDGLRSCDLMRHRSSATVGDLKLIGEPGFSGVMDSVQRAPSWVIVAVSCVTTLVMFTAAVGIWIARYDSLSDPRLVPNPFAGEWTPVVTAPQAFPWWAEVPHLSDPPSTGSGVRPPTAEPPLQPAQQLTFRAVDPVAIKEGPMVLPPTTDQSLPRLAHAPPDVDLRTREARETGPVAPEQPALIEAMVVAPDVVRTQDPAATLRARTPRPRSAIRPVIEVLRPAEPNRDTEQTASVFAAPGVPRPRIDTGAVVRASVRHSRSDHGPSRGPAASSAPWTLPPALAPTP